MNKILLSLALIGCGTVHAAPCPAELNGFPCARWTTPEYKPDGTRVTREQVDGHIVYWERNKSGVITRGQTAVVPENSYYFPNASKSSAYRFYVVTIYRDGQRSPASNVETWGRR